MTQVLISHQKGLRVITNCQLTPTTLKEKGKNIENVAYNVFILFFIFVSLLCNSFYKSLSKSWHNTTQLTENSSSKNTL